MSNALIIQLCPTVLFSLLNWMWKLISFMHCPINIKKYWSRFKTSHVSIMQRYRLLFLINCPTKYLEAFFFLLPYIFFFGSGVVIAEGVLHSDNHFQNSGIFSILKYHFMPFLITCHCFPFFFLKIKINRYCWSSYYPQQL